VCKRDRKRKKKMQIQNHLRAMSGSSEESGAGGEKFVATRRAEVGGGSMERRKEIEDKPGHLRGKA